MKVIVVSTSTNTVSQIQQLLIGPQQNSIVAVSSILEAKQKLLQEHYDLCIIQTPAQDEFGTHGALNIAHSFQVGVILLIKQSLYDQVLYQVRESDVFPLGIPCSSQTLYQCIQFCMIHRNHVYRLEMEINHQKKKIQDERIITRAKLYLMQNENMSEEEAHHYIEKRAMQLSKTKVAIAKDILM